MLDIVESSNTEIYPANGHVIFYGVRKRNLLTGREVPAAGLAATGIISAAADSDTPVGGAAALSVSLVDVGPRGTLELYLERIAAAAITAALTDVAYPDGSEVFEIIKTDSARRVTPLTVRRIRTE